jgi:hypothetical protein
MFAQAYWQKAGGLLVSKCGMGVHSTIENIISFPKAWTILEDDIRRCQIRRFPYGIIYSQHGEVIFILAVMHLHRDPEYWKDRV